MDVCYHGLRGTWEELMAELGCAALQGPGPGTGSGKEEGAEGWVLGGPPCCSAPQARVLQAEGMGVLTLAAGAGLSQPKGLGLLGTRKRKGCGEVLLPLPAHLSSLAPGPVVGGTASTTADFWAGCFFVVGAVGCPAPPTRCQ